MFPASYQTVGYIPAGTQVSDPANDAQLLSETESHYWFQFDTGTGMQDADPLMPGATIGQTFTTSTGTFAEVPDALREKTEVQLVAEIYSQASALFGQSGLQDTTVLEETFNDVDLVGRPLSIGNFVSTTSAGFIFTATTNTYTPYIDMGDEAYPTSHDEVTTGTSYQEVLTNFPLGSQVLTGLYLNITLSGPSGPAQTYERTLLDKIGYAARQGLASPNITINPTEAPTLSDLDVYTLDALPGLEDPHPSAALANDLSQEQATLNALQQSGAPASATSALDRQYVINLTRQGAIDYMEVSDKVTEQLANVAHVVTYFDRPRLVLFSNQVQINGQTAMLSFSIDLRRDMIRVEAFPGQNPDAGPGFNITRGALDTSAEAEVLKMINAANGISSPIVNTAVVFAAAAAQGIPILTVSTQNLTVVDSLDFSADAKARITAAVGQGRVVLVPASNVDLGGGVKTVAWYEVDPNTGEMIGVTEDGGHQANLQWAGGLAVTSTIIGLIIRFAVINPARATGTALPVWVTYVKDGAGIGVAVGVLALAGLEITKYAAVASLFLVAAFLPLLLLIEPSLPPVLSDPELPPLTDPSKATEAVSLPAGQAAGAIGESAKVLSTTVSGTLAASWSVTTTAAFQASALSASGTSVRNASGQAVGSGAVALSAAGAVPVAVAGNDLYALSGTGSLSFYRPSERSLGVSGNWQSYTATVTGDVSITLTVPPGALTLNGQALPAGTYTITTNSATLSGSGTMSSPNFAGTASITSTNGTINLGPGTGTLSVGGKPLNPDDEATLDGYDGTMSVAANGDGTDSVSLGGTADNVLQVSGSPATLTTDQNTPITFQTNVETSLADTYNLTVNAPAGWTVSIDSKGNVTATPAPGLQSGTYPIQIIVQSQTDPNLEAQTTVDVTITATQPGINFGVVSDPLFTVPYDGAQLPTAFRAVIQNLGPAADTYNLTFSNVPSGFTLLNSGTSVTIPAGQTGIVGIYLQPNTGQTLSAPGTVLPFTVKATSTTNSAITKTQTVTFTVPAIDAVTVTGNPTSLGTTPGTGVADTLTFSNVGNVPETVALTDTLQTGLSASALTPLTLAVGQTLTETVTLTPASSTPLNTLLQATFTATYGPNGSPQTQTLTVPVQVVAPGVQAVSSAAVAAGQAGNTALGNRLNDLSTALTTLYQSPTDPVAKGQATANLDSLISLVTNDPFLASFAPAMTTARGAIAAAASAADVQTALTNLGTALGALAQGITDEAAHGFTLGLLITSSQQALPATPAVFQIDLKNTGSQTTTYDLSVSGLPSNVTSAFSQTSVTLAPGQAIAGGTNGVTLSLTETGNTLFATGFTVTATAEGAAEITNSTPGALTLRDTFLQVSGVTTNPPFVAPGGQVQVSAKVQSALNQPQMDTVSYVVEDSGGKTVFTSTPVPLALGITSALTTANLGTLDTAAAGLAQGTYTLLATIFDPTGQPIPGSAGQGSLFVGLPVTSSVTTTPTTVPTGTDTVTTTVQVHGTTTFPAPLTVLGQVTTGDDELSAVLYPNGNQELAYTVGANGVSIIDVSNPSSPQVLSTFAQDVIVKGGYNIARVVGHDLLVATNVTLNSSGFNFIVYDLTNPLNPTLVSNTDIPYRFLSDMYVLGNVALFPIEEFDYYPGGEEYYFAQSSNVIAVDISNLSKPTVVGKLFASNDPHPQGGAVIVNSQIAYTVSSTETGGDTSSGVGDLRLINISNPAMPTLIGDLHIPGTETLTNIALQGSRALVVGSSGGLLQPFTSKVAGLTGNVTLTVLDISDPSNPKVVGNTLVTEATSSQDATLPSSRRDLVDLGNGLFALSNVLEGGKPALLLIDASDPNNIIVSAQQTPALDNGLTVAGSTLYAGTPTGLVTYNIGQLVSTPVTVSVQVPKDSANFSLVTNSFDKPPTQIISGTTFDTYVWNRSLAFGNTDLSFSWKTKLSNLNPNETRDVTLDTTVGFVSQGTPGTLSLPATSVTAAPIIALSPSSQTVQPAATATYDVRVTNPTAGQVTYGLSEQGLPFAGESFENTSVTLAAGASTDVLLHVASNPTTAPGSYPFTVTAYDTSGSGVRGTAQATLVMAGPPVLQPQPDAHGIVVSLTPTQAIAGQGTTAHYVVQLTNTGSTDDTFTLTATGLPPSVAATFGQTTIDVPPGASNFRDVTLTLTANQGTTPGGYPFTVSAASTSDPSVTNTTNGTLTVTAGGVQVTLNPLSGDPGSSFQATVENTGTTTDTFNLVLAGPAALVASLGLKQVTLAPGASQIVPISTGAVDFAVKGTLNLTAAATSTTNPAIQDAATAGLSIPATQGMTAEFSPASQTLSSPGKATFLLMVHNTGNTEDSYTARIIGTSGPITANLVGLDGSPTQTIPIFILPGLSTGAILVQADLSQVASGTVKVLISSLNHRDITSTAVATLSAAEPAPGPSPGLGPGPGPVPVPVQVPLPSDGPEITLVQRYGIHWMPTTLVLYFNQALDPVRAQDVHEYQLVDPHGHDVAITAADYDPTTDTVTLHLSRRINFHRRYKLTVDGASPAGLTDTQGLLLDGKATGHPGSNYVTTVDRRDLVWPERKKKAIHKEVSIKDPRSTKVATGHDVHSTQLFRRSWPFPASGSASMSHGKMPAVHLQSARPRHLMARLQPAERKSLK